MYQIDNSTVAATQPTSTTPGTPGFFTDGNAGTGLSPTVVPAEFLNTLMLELINIVTGAGLTLSKSSFSQAYQAIRRLSQKTVVLADAGAVNAYAAVNSPALVSGDLVSGLVQRVSIATLNTGASTYAPDGLTSKPIYGMALAALQGGELPAKGIATLMYLVASNVNSGNGAWILIECTGGAQQVAPGTASQHAVQLGQIQTQAGTAFTTAGAAPAFTLTTSPAISALAANQRLRVKFNAAGTTGSNTLNVSGLGAVALMQYGPDGVLVPAVITSGLLSDVEYNGTYMVVLDPVVSGYVGLQSISASVASNALTLGLAPTALSFRSATAGAGTSTPVSITSALSLVVPSGATLGTQIATSTRLVLLALYNGGSPVLGVINLAGGINLDESGVISSTAISTSATASNVVYTTAAVTNSPYRVVGYIDIAEVTPGTWATGPTAVQGAGGQALAALSSLGYGVGTSPSNSYGVTYYNTTGRTKQIFVTGQSATAGDFLVQVNGRVQGRMYQIVNVSCGVGGTVPPNGSYIVTGPGVPVLTSWTEQN